MKKQLILTLLAVSTLSLPAVAFAQEDVTASCRQFFPNQKLNIRQDDTNRPFENDPALLGQWTAVDFVKTPADFNPQSPKHTQDELFLKEKIFLPGGQVVESAESWTKGYVLHQADKTASAYEIKNIGKEKYLFLEWKSGDYTCLGRAPYYYVLKKSADLRTDDLNVPFKNDKKVLGKWKAVDFVFSPADFDPAQKFWRGELYLKTLTFQPEGKMPMSPAITWTKGRVLHHGDKTASAYQIKKINGKEYMFFEWKSGDYSYRGQNPAYYVLERQK